MNISKSVECLFKALNKFNPVELRELEIADRRGKNSIDELDNSDHLIIAHFTDVQRHKFHEIKTFKNAVVIFHTYDTGWHPNKLKSNSVCLHLNNDINIFCVGSDELLENVESFVNHLVKAGQINFNIFEGFLPDFE